MKTTNKKSKISKPGTLRVIRSEIRREKVPGLQIPVFKYSLIHGPDKLGKIFQGFLKNFTQEQVWVIFFQGPEMLAISNVGIGTMQASGFDIRLITRQAIEIMATELVVIHSNVVPTLDLSENDALLTKALAEGLAYFGIVLADHIVVGPNTAISMTSKYPNCCNPDKTVDALEGADGNARPNLRESLEALVDTLRSKGGPSLTMPSDINVPDGVAGLPGFGTPIKVSVDFSSPEATKRDVDRLIKEISDLQKASIAINATNPETSKRPVLVLMTPSGPLEIKNTDDVNDIVLNKIVPFLRAGSKFGAAEAKSLADMVNDGLKSN